MKNQRILISIESNGKKEERYIDSFKPNVIEETVTEMSLKLDMKKDDVYDILITMGNKVLMHRCDKAV